MRRAEDSTDAKTANTRCFPCALLKARVLSSSPNIPLTLSGEGEIFLGKSYRARGEASKPACAGRRILPTPKQQIPAVFRARCSKRESYHLHRVGARQTLTHAAKRAMRAFMPAPPSSPKSHGFWRFFIRLHNISENLCLRRAEDFTNHIKGRQTADKYFKHTNIAICIQKFAHCKV